MRRALNATRHTADGRHWARVRAFAALGGIEGLRANILLEHPEMKAGVGSGRRDKFCALCHQSGAYACSMMRSQDVQVVEERAPVGVDVKGGVYEPDEFAIDFRQVCLSHVGRIAEALRPNRDPLADDITVEERIRIRAAIVLLPARGM